MYQLNAHKSLGAAWDSSQNTEGGSGGWGRTPLIYPKSWVSGEGPGNWKPIYVIPVYKKGMKKHPETYRPVGLTSVPGKIMDKMLWTHLKNSAVTRHSQHGLTKRKSCLTNSVSFHDKATYLVDEEKMLEVAFLDFNKSSDTVPHSSLLEKLSTCEISRFPVHWVKNWLKGRTHWAVEKLHLAAIQPPVVSLRAQC